MPSVLMFMFSPLDGVPPVMNEGTTLSEHGYQVHLVGIRYSQQQPALESVAHRFVLRRMTLVTRWIFGDNDMFSMVRYAEFALRCIWAGLTTRVDIFVAHDLVTLPFVYPVARLKRKPVLYRAHEVWSEQAPDFPLASFWRALDRWFSPRVDALITPDVNRARIYEEEYGARQKATVVFNCPKLFDLPAASRLRQTLTERGVTASTIVYYQGGLGPARSVTELAEAMLHLPEEIGLTLVGKPAGDFLDWLGTFVSRHRLQHRVAYLGAMAHGPELFSLASGADIGAVFARNDCRNNLFNVTATNKLFEYMMVGLPVIGSDAPGYKDFLEGQQIGLSVNAETPTAIAQEILRLHRNPDERKAMGRKARALAESLYHWDKESVKLLDVYRRLIPNGGPA